MSNLQDSLDALKNTDPADPVQTVGLATTDADLGSEPEYQQYASTRVSVCLIAPGGKRINFANYEYYTKDPELIAFLDKEIAAGLRGFTKGKLVRAKDINPAAALKRKHIEEFLASQEGRDFTSAQADPAVVAKKAGVLSSAGVVTAGESGQ